ncbi:MAG: DUF4326 domain-containing protein [Acidimicrobiaceae bacterium]|nr:DUF4326 domain-containing protein [Acidimicrobiaceae bacterium]
MPARVQLRRTRGWRKPPGTVVVARPSRWGNPFRVGTDGDRARCADRYRLALVAGELSFTVEDVRRELAGADLACWCPLDGPCHADVLLEVANRRSVRRGAR